ncbi:unnamed protein product [Closterium sp. NIES-64]|nr:unnamed protein product [Closterium sp. NIES-64]
MIPTPAAVTFFHHRLLLNPGKSHHRLPLILNTSMPRLPAATPSHTPLLPPLPTSLLPPSPTFLSHLPLSPPSLTSLSRLPLSPPPDLPSAVGEEDLTHCLELRDLKGRSAMVMPVCAYDGTGVREGVTWLVEAMRKSQRADLIKQRADAAAAF